jgi:nitrite reductase (NO-forming)
MKKIGTFCIIGFMSFVASCKNSPSSHVIGEIFDNVYREAGIVSPPVDNIQSTPVPAGGATVVEFGVDVPGNYTLVDHSIFRIEKGAVGTLRVSGQEAPDIYSTIPHQ